jgi:hypothetical protein
MAIYGDSYIAMVLDMAFDEACVHLRAIQNVIHPKRQECEECVKIGDKWVHLRTLPALGVATHPGREGLSWIAIGLLLRWNATPRSQLFPGAAVERIFWKRGSPRSGSHPQRYLRSLGVML